MKVMQLKDADGVGMEENRIKLVLNKVEKDFSKDEEEILVRKSGIQVVAKVPNTSEIRKLHKSGRPGVHNVRLGFTKQLGNLLNEIVEVPLVRSSMRSGWFKKVLHR